MPSVEISARPSQDPCALPCGTCNTPAYLMNIHDHANGTAAQHRHARSDSPSHHMLPLPGSLVHCSQHSPCTPLRPSSRCPACACPSPCLWGNGSQHTPTAGTGARKRCGLIPHACPTPSGSLMLRTRTRTAARRPPYTALTPSPPSPFFLLAMNVRIHVSNRREFMYRNNPEENIFSLNISFQDVSFSPCRKSDLFCDKGKNPRRGS